MLGRGGEGVCGGKVNAVRVSEYRLELGVWCMGRGCPIVFVPVRHMSCVMAVIRYLKMVTVPSLPSPPLPPFFPHTGPVHWYREGRDGHLHQTCGGRARLCLQHNGCHPRDYQPCVPSPPRSRPTETQLCGPVWCSHTIPAKHGKSADLPPALNRWENG